MFIRASDSEIEIQSCVFKNIKNDDMLGAGVQCRCNNLTITDSHFYNLSGGQGGALYLNSRDASTIFDLRGNIFESNSA